MDYITITICSKPAYIDIRHWRHSKQYKTYYWKRVSPD